MSAALARLALVMCLLKWAPDFVFGFIFPLAACKGLAAREGYMHTEPGSLYWAVSGQSEKMEIWTVWMSREDIRHILTSRLLPCSSNWREVRTATEAKGLPKASFAIL
jgi:hypothetical protein